VKPKRSSTPGPKFSMMMSQLLQEIGRTPALPSAVFMLTVIERLLQLSIVKYRLSAFGTSRSCPPRRVALRILDLMTSAPIQASSCEQVAPPARATCRGCGLP